jgi:hypothetical protein
LPFLRFTRDKRGYETTALVHASRHRGRATQRILYWFRTPPGVKVGRPALDEDAIRWIEEHNPEIEFNWQKILEAHQPSAPPADESRTRRPRGRGDRPAKDNRRRPDQQPGTTSTPSDLDRSSDAAHEVDVETPAEDISGASAPPPPEPVTPLVPLIQDALEQFTHPDAEERSPVRLSPPEEIAGKEQLIRMRARYAELQARITERGGEPARIEELRAQAALLNPDTWVTEDEVRQGLLEFDAKLRDIRSALGLRPRRRSRRGGRRRRRPGQGGQTPSVAGAAETTSGPSNSEGTPDDGEPDEKDGEDNEDGGNL